MAKRVKWTKELAKSILSKVSSVKEALRTKTTRNAYFYAARTGQFGITRHFDRLGSGGRPRGREA